MDKKTDAVVLMISRALLGFEETDGHIPAKKED
jgi:hypothetical protein